MNSPSDNPSAYNPLDLSGQTILVTGASSGLGRAIAVLCDKLGARIVLVGRNRDRLDATRSQLFARDHRVEPYDLIDTEGIPSWMQKLATEVGPLSGLVHSAGVFQVKPVRFLTDKAWDEVMTPNVRAAVQLVRGFRQRNVVRPPASVVLLSSVMALVGQPGTTSYAASKGALVAMTRSLALELAAEQIRVNCVAPGQVRSEMMGSAERVLTSDQIAAIEKMHPLGIGEPDDVAHAAAFLLARTGRWITGSTLVVDGGYTSH